MTTVLPGAEQLAAARLRLAVEGPVARITLDHPERRNAQTTDTWDGLAAIGRALPGDVRVVVLAGAGAAFSSGLDTKEAAGRVAEIAGLPAEEAADRIDAWQGGFAWLRRPDIVSIAAVQGYALGAGFQLALACDLRVLADDAQLAMAEITLGLVPDLTGTTPLVELVGYPRALELCLTGRRVGAEEALRLRLAELVVPREELASTVDDLVAALVAAPRAAAAEVKALLRTAGKVPFDEQRRLEREAQVRRLRDLAGVGE